MPPYFPSERGELAAFRGRIILLLLTDEELRDPFWQPTVSLRNFLQFRVRPATYFIQYCGLPAPNGEVPDMPAAEREELRCLVLRLVATLVCGILPPRLRGFRSFPSLTPLCSS